MADLAEKRHDNVRRVIWALVEQGVISHPQIEFGPQSANGVAEKVLLVGKRDSYIVMAQLSPEFTARLVDRWQELEAKQAAPAALSVDRDLEPDRWAGQRLELPLRGRGGMSRDPDRHQPCGGSDEPGCAQDRGGSAGGRGAGLS